jgi:uncharacterized membrane protein
LWYTALMPGLRHTDDRTFVSAFQSIDRAIINAWFMASFFGALVLTGLAAGLVWRDAPKALMWIAAAFVLYLAAVVITFAVNVPLNDAIKTAGQPDRIGDLADVRRRFNQAKWSAWNLVRTLTSTAAFACLTVALIAYGGRN